MGYGWWWFSFYTFFFLKIFLQLFEKYQCFRNLNINDSGSSWPPWSCGPFPAPAVAQWKPQPPSKARALRGARACLLRVLLHPLLPGPCCGNHSLPWAPGVALSLRLSWSLPSFTPTLLWAWGQFSDAREGCSSRRLAMPGGPHPQGLQGDGAAPRCRELIMVPIWAVPPRGLTMPLWGGVAPFYRKLRLQSLSRIAQLQGAELGLVQG